MCDETFSINCSAEPPEGVDKGWFMFFITLLDQKNFFSYRKSVPFVAKRLGVSRYTIYKYLGELNEQENAQTEGEAER